jgi:hypothetical protein
MSGTRPVLTGLQASNHRLDTEVSVVLEASGRQVSGRAEGLATPESELRAATAATLEALQQLLPGDVRFDIDWLEVTRVGGEEVVHVGITSLTSAGSQRVVGSAPVRRDRLRAASRATLDALNRQLDRLLATRLR